MSRIEIECSIFDLKFIKGIEAALRKRVLKELKLPQTTECHINANNLAEDGFVYLFLNGHFYGSIKISKDDRNDQTH